MELHTAGEMMLLIGKLAFFGIGAVAGARALRLARAETGFGQHSLAALAIMVGTLGLILFPVSAVAAPGPLRATVAIAGEVLLRLGLGLLAVFVWRVFGATSRLAAGLAAVCIAALTGTFVWELAVQDMASVHLPARPSAYAAQISVMLPILWSAIETAREWRRARKRVALGLGDAATATRFGLWSLATACLAVICLLANAIAWTASAGHPVAADLLLALRGLLYWPVVVAVWLGFFQPASHRPRDADVSAA